MSFFRSNGHFSWTTLWKMTATVATCDFGVRMVVWETVGPAFRGACKTQMQFGFLGLYQARQNASKDEGNCFATSSVLHWYCKSGNTGEFSTLIVADIRENFRNICSFQKGLGIYRQIETSCADTNSQTACPFAFYPSFAQSAPRSRSTCLSLSIM